MLVYQQIFGQTGVPCIVHLQPCQLRSDACAIHGLPATVDIFGHTRVPCIVYLPPRQLRLWNIVYVWSRRNTLFPHWLFNKIPVTIPSWWYPAWGYNARTVALWIGGGTVRPLLVSELLFKSHALPGTHYFWSWCDPLRALYASIDRFSLIPSGPPGILDFFSLAAILSFTYSEPRYLTVIYVITYSYLWLHTLHTLLKPFRPIYSHSGPYNFEEILSPVPSSASSEQIIRADTVGRASIS